MHAARLDGLHASPKGLRHGFGVAAVSAGIPLNLVQKWLGHAQLTITAIYAIAVGTEEKNIARRCGVRARLPDGRCFGDVSGRNRLDN
jgi:site-specific recombinase XerD